MFSVPWVGHPRGQGSVWFVAVECFWGSLGARNEGFLRHRNVSTVIAAHLLAVIFVFMLRDGRCVGGSDQMVRRLVILLTSIPLLQSCGAVPRSTQPMQVGPDTYRIMARASLARKDASQEMAFSEANAFCQSMNNRKILTTNMHPSENDGFELTFRCLREGDPELVRPTFERSPDTVIKIR